MSFLLVMSPSRQRSAPSPSDLLARRKREWIVLTTLLMLALGAYCNVKRVVIHGISMYPTFHTGQSLVVWTSIPRDRLRVGDVIVFHSPDGDELMKRIAYIQSGPLNTHPEPVPTTEGRLPFEKVFNVYLEEIASGQAPMPAADQTIYVLGDNYEHSSDSRDFGPIAPSQVLGKVLE